MGPTLRKRIDSSPEKTLKTQPKSITEHEGGSEEDNLSKVQLFPLRRLSPLIPGFVLIKLVFFSILAILLPIFVFYYTLGSFGSTYAGVSAAVTANFVLIMYIVVAYLEGEDEEAEDKSK